MKLAELNARLMKLNPDNSMHQVETVADADGVLFLCPKCYRENNGPAGTHSIMCWFSKVPVDRPVGNGRWNPVGHDINDLTFVGPGAFSILLLSGCGWHGFIKDGCAE